MAKKFKPSLVWLFFRLSTTGFKELFKNMRKIAIIFKIDRLWLRWGADSHDETKRTYLGFSV
ncbi:hypothetical protein PanWU01x14_259950 [Parasponia andersonii]|uniref:Uncharacterized protein n=1 Tax=Parasponia andersonii TaxID=3476 RepID=A0A2P5B914_PARAD|nr:hypothetical protein PanWU01x14_259950 [Parasponia andersonii]